MSVLESFFLLIKMDASGAKQGAEDLKKSESSISKSLTNVDNQANKLSKSFGGLIGSLGRMAFAFVSVGSIIAGIKSTARFTDELNKTAESLGANIEELSAWSDAAKKSGGSAEAFQGSISQLTTQLTAFATRGKSALSPYFQELGIRMTDARGKARSFSDILPELAKRFELLSKTESFGLGQKLGLDEGTIRLLQKGQKEVDALIKRQKELGIITKADAEAVSKFNDQLDDTGHSFRTIFSSANQYILPALTWVLKKLEVAGKFISKNKILFNSFAIGTAAVLTAVLLPAIVRVGAATVVAFAPFILAASVIASLGAIIGLIIDDFYHFYTGQKSFIGYLIEKYPVVGTILKSIEVALKLIWNILKPLAGLLLDAFIDPFNAWNNFKNSIMQGLDELLKKFPQLKPIIDIITESFSNAGKIISEVWKTIAALVTLAVEAITSGVEKVIAAVSKVKNALSVSPETSIELKQQYAKMQQVSSSPVNTYRNAGLGNYASKHLVRNSTVNVGDVNVQSSATNANELSQNIVQSLENNIRQAINQSDDGVAA